MFTPGIKLLFGFGILFLLAAIVYGWTSGGVDWGLFPGELGSLYFAMLGALTLGWRGAVGDHVGYTVLVAGAAVCFALGGIIVALRDADAEAVAEVAGTATAPAYRTPGTPSLFAPAMAFGLGLLVLGLATTGWLIIAGFGIMALMALEWIVQAWADRATGDHRVNLELRNRIINPIEVPVVGALLVGFMVFGVAHFLLSVGKLTAVWATIGFAALVFVVAIVLAAVPRLAKPLLGTVVALGAVAVLVLGIVGASQGEREFEHQEQLPANVQIETEGGRTIETIAPVTGALPGGALHESPPTTAAAGGAGGGSGGGGTTGSAPQSGQGG